VFGCRGVTLSTYAGRIVDFFFCAFVFLLLFTILPPFSQCVGSGHVIDISSQEILLRCTNGITVVGPVNEDEAKKDHETYWKRFH
jgi:hypothetical protein